VEIDKDGSYEIIVFANQVEGAGALRVLATERIEFKHISTLAVVVPADKCPQICSLLTDQDILIGGHYKFLYRDYEQDFFKRAAVYSPSRNDGEFLQGIALCYVAPCLADEQKIRLIAYFSRDISEILPYLNTTIKGAIYNKKASTLSYNRGQAAINLYNIKVTVAKAADIIRAWQLLDELRETINTTHRQRDQLQPSYEQRVKPAPFQLYGWLPKTNCQACGEVTCLAFAVKLLQGGQRLENCPGLREDPRYTENRKILEEMVQVLGL
jgi:ArsR family metal-binding transcriptional regulator